MKAQVFHVARSRFGGFEFLRVFSVCLNFNIFVRGKYLGFWCVVWPGSSRREYRREGGGSTGTEKTRGKGELFLMLKDKLSRTFYFLVGILYVYSSCPIVLGCIALVEI